MSQALPVSKKRKKEQPGTVINCGQNKYVIESLLGSGGMGDLYKVHLVKDKTRIYAMKTERISVNEAYKARLKVELNVFEAI
ncbi:hypothetical protein PENTCL1PPCAC_13158 [Pristionchus entomophagus]|uniref:Protein kinase n=1 Tax=Pristionchus entomophagus TaxID=358040 RepID=A0AAV5TA64_9BILA|nr:hypothetical protein PENTCL1PPCAC_13158 [Pristionchus entomophagus]